MKERYSRVYSKKWRKQACVYIKSKQNRTFKGLPNRRLSSNIQGNNASRSEFPEYLEVKVLKSILLTEVSMEAFRITLNRLLSKKYSKLNWCFYISKYPHLILRQHKQPSGGHVDRVSMGMRLAYGQPFARAAKIMEGETFIKLYYNAICNRKVLKSIIQKSSTKIATPVKITTVVR
jgi:ribosomal protein L16/L10AE